MYVSSNLTKSRLNVFYLRFPLPSRLHPQGKQTSIRLSLETRCPREALHLSRLLSYAGNQLVKKLENDGVVDYQTIRDIVFDYFKSMRDRTKARIAKHGRLTEADKTALTNSQAFASQALVTEDYTFAGTDAELTAVIDTYELPIARGSHDYATLRVEFLKAFRDYCGSVIEYDSRFDGYNFKTDPASLAMKEATQRTSRKKLADVLEVYIAEKIRLKKWREGVEIETRPQFNLLLRYLGEDTSLHISDEVAKDVKNMLLRLPKHVNKRQEFKGLTIEQIISQKHNDLLSPQSVSKYITTYHTFYEWAVKRKEIKENPFGGLVDDISNVANERESFAKEQSIAIINRAMDCKKPHQKWGVLLAFYTGARLNEIAQLDAEDIMETDSIWCISFNDTGKFKKLKNKSSNRIIPLHSRLLELGLLDFVKDKKGHLFNELSYNVKDGYGRNLGRWFNESLLPELDFKSKSLVFHSIRHTVAEQLRNNSVELSLIKDIVGHTQGDITLDVYANHIHKSLLQKAVNTLSYS